LFKSYLPETHTHRTYCFTWTTKVVGNNNNNNIDESLDVK